jgi:hypothetical protein
VGSPLLVVEVFGLPRDEPPDPALSSLKAFVRHALGFGTTELKVPVSELTDCSVTQVKLRNASLSQDSLNASPSQAVQG